MAGTIFRATIGATRSQVSAVLPGSYEMDGKPIASPWEAGTLAWGEIVAISTLRPGQSIALGGGAFADTTITRLEG